MEFLRSLLSEDKKKPALKKARKSVYHADYVKTAKKSYRSYDAQTRAHEDEELSLKEEANEPAGVQGQFQQPVHQRGKQQDLPPTSQGHQPVAGPEELGQHLIELTGLLAKYDQMKPVQSQQEEENVPDQQAQQQDIRQQQDNQQNQQQRQQQQPPEKPLQFSSFLYNTVDILSEEGGRIVFDKDDNPHENSAEEERLRIDTNKRKQDKLKKEKTIKEDKWNFNELPPQANPHAPAGVSNVNANKSPEPQGADISAVKKAATQHIKQILNIVKQLGPDAKQQLTQLCAKHCGDKANRVLAVLSKAGQKLGIEI